MKISFDKKQIITISLLFSFSFLLGFSVFGGFSKLYRHSLARDVQQFNQEQELQQKTLQAIEENEDIPVDTKPLQAELLNENIEIITEENPTSEINIDAPSQEEGSIDIKEEEKIEDVSLNNEEITPIQEDIITPEAIIDNSTKETPESEEIEPLETESQEPLSTIDKAFLGEKK